MKRNVRALRPLAAPRKRTRRKAEGQPHRDVRTCFDLRRCCARETRVSASCVPSRCIRAQLDHERFAHRAPLNPSVLRRDRVGAPCFGDLTRSQLSVKKIIFNKANAIPLAGRFLFSRNRFISMETLRRGELINLFHKKNREIENRNFVESPHHRTGKR